MDFLNEQPKILTIVYLHAGKIVTWKPKNQNIDKFRP